MTGPKQRRIDSLREDVERQAGKINDLEAKLAVAVDRLRVISDGSYFEAECTGIVTAGGRAQRTAVHGLAKLTTMRQR